MSQMEPPHFTSTVFRRAVLVLSTVVLVSFARHASALGETPFVDMAFAPGDFVLVDAQTADILVATNDWPGVIRAAGDLAKDVNRVTGKSPAIVNDPKPAGKNAVIIGTIGKSGIIDRLIQEKKIDASEIAGRFTESMICPNRSVFRRGIIGQTCRRHITTSFSLRLENSFKARHR